MRTKQTAASVRAVSHHCLELIHGRTDTSYPALCVQSSHYFAVPGGVGSAVELATYCWVLLALEASWGTLTCTIAAQRRSLQLPLPQNLRCR